MALLRFEGSMRKSRVEAAATRARIVSIASEMFRANGIHASSISQVMAEAGLTHGGFYAHFDSKEDLIGEACLHAAEASFQRLQDAGTVRSVHNFDVRAAIQRYLSAEHRSKPATGCLFASLAPELGRQSAGIRETATQWFERVVQLMTHQAEQWGEPDPRGWALGVLTSLVGAMAMARLTSDPELSDEILCEARDRLLGTMPTS